MPESASIAIYEDNQDWQATIKGILTDSGHKVVALASSAEDAERITAQIEAGQLKVDAVCIDSNLDDNETKQVHGRAYADRLQALGIPVFDISSSGQGYGSHSSPKDSPTFSEIGSSITNL